jgi:NAD(P)-dependent dehydrogenase (short-subunit alcohol dehydrogenase family)
MAARVAVITGAGSGIGREVAGALAATGFALVLAGRRREPLEETATAAGDAGGAPLVVPTDVTDPDQVTALFERTEAEHGRVDVLFNNAGTFGPSAPFPDVPLDAWRTVLDTNLTGMFLCAQAAFRLMARQDPRGGRIINNGSISAHVPRPNAAAYTVTKHAVTGLTKQIALDGRAHGVACGQIDVGNAATPLLAGISSGALQADGSTKQEPTMDAARVAEAVAYMAGLPLDANVLTMTVMATTMPYVGRG